MPEQGVDLRAETLEMQATAGAELNAMQAELTNEGAGAASSPVAGEANPALVWQNTTQSLSAAYMNNMGRTDDPSRVGSFSAMQKQNLAMSSNAQGMTANPAPAAGALPPNPLLSNSLPNNSLPPNPLLSNTSSEQVQAETFSNNVRGFTGMKKPFSNPYSQEEFGSGANSQFEAVETISPRRRTPQGAAEQSALNGAALTQPVFGVEEGDGPITPLAPPAPTQPAQSFGQEISKNENAIPGGMFMQFDNIPDI